MEIYQFYKCGRACVWLTAAFGQLFMAAENHLFWGWIWSGPGPRVPEVAE